MNFFSRGCFALALGYGLLSGAQAQQLPQMPQIPQAPAAAAPSLNHCAAEGGRCAFFGVRTVVYGAGQKFNTKTAEGGIDCNNATFGDPLPGTVKACYILSQPGK